jgi:uncharacterized protein (TIGR03435 family)
MRSLSLKWRRSNRPEERFSLTVNRSGMLNTTATSVSELLKFAYDLHPRQIAGGPSWLESEKFDVSGKPDRPGMPTVDQMKIMIQKLLADRFALTFRHELFPALADRRCEDSMSGTPRSRNLRMSCRRSSWINL